MKAVGRRLREERARRWRNGDEFAEKSGIHATSLGNYERGDRAPNAALLLTWHDLGIDIGYVLTGVRWSGSVSPEQQRLIDYFDRISVDERNIVLALLSRLTGENAPLKIDTDEGRATLHSPSVEYRAQPQED